MKNKRRRRGKVNGVKEENEKKTEAVPFQTSEEENLVDGMTYVIA